MRRERGTVLAVNNRKGMFIVEIENGEFAVFELLDSIEITVGDELQGDLCALGSGTLLHATQRKTFSVYGQSGTSSRTACDRLL